MTDQDIENPKRAADENPGATYLNLDELRTMYMLLQSQYISYENPKAINLIRKVRSILGETI